MAFIYKFVPQNNDNQLVTLKNWHFFQCFMKRCLNFHQITLKLFVISVDEVPWNSDSFPRCIPSFLNLEPKIFWNMTDLIIWFRIQIIFFKVRRKTNEKGKWAKAMWLHKFDKLQLRKQLALTFFLKLPYQIQKSETEKCFMTSCCGFI